MSHKRWKHNSVLPALLMTLFLSANESVLALDAQKAMPKAVTLYSHGETLLAFRNPDGSFEGEAVDIASCVFGDLLIGHEISYAPLSRARELIDAEADAVW